ncbi:DUF551 domain-containing protein [Metapseudomonas otitidis]|uniref:DUF551 domain-containing protein n=1 Tax=Metapseudomonas otitidis TaxID=319939 RepID=UPI002448BB11|nr:DUF551 domain-containing protein [Pseudomonas otitidis]MDG9785311.1 DUF551 domain-containing protein [Pseudomonas otitidis]
MSQWIKCSERMPKPNQEVLVYRKGNRASHGPFFAKAKNREMHPWEYLDGDTCYMAITHWMPLPEPPED